MNKNLIDMNNNVKYVILEDEICYDWNDYAVWGAVLYDIENKKIITSKYGHGTDLNERPESVNLIDCADYVLPNEIIDVMLKQLNIGFGGWDMQDALTNYALRASLDNPVAIPVNVNRGRKAKGNGYIVYAVSEAQRYGLGAYRGEKNFYPVILNTNDKTFTRINSFGYCDIAQEFKDMVVANIRKNTANTIDEVMHIAHAWAYNMSYSHCDTDNYHALIRSIASRGFKDLAIDPFVTKCVNAEQKRLADIEEAKMNEKLPKIIEWVKANTDKTTEEDILELAKHIYHKYNH